jgi:uncharacterized protein
MKAHGMIAPEAVLFQYYTKGSPLAETLLRHSRQVRDKALAVARRVPHLYPDLDFIAEAAMLHDIGIYQTAAPRIGCRGTLPYVAHGVIGRHLLEQCGLPAHALVCERHVGAGITPRDIQEQGLPLAHRDMCPVSIEETIICYADKFFSKTNGGTAHTVQAIVTELARYGPDKAERFMAWHQLFAG